MNDRKIAIIGCGNLGLTIVRGLLDHKAFDPSRLVVTRRNTSGLAQLVSIGVSVLTDNKTAVEQADMVVLAVKPYNVKPIVEEISPLLDSTRHIVISLATGVTLSEIEQWSGTRGLPMFRAMPNTAADVNQSVTAICHFGATDEHRNVVSKLFNRIGTTLFINEDLMEAATILGACGIAYVLRFMRAMIQGGIEVGFDAKTATAIVSQTMRGAAELIIQNGTHPESEIDKVTTPKGCTITGLNEMEHAGFSSALIRGIVASHRKIAK